MAITRSNAADYLDARFSALATGAGQTATDDSADGYGADIDDALRDLSVAEADLSSATVAESSRRAYYALCEYYAARRFWIRYAAKGNVRLGPAAQSYESAVSALKAIMDDAQDRAATEGIAVSSATDWALVRLGLDFIEPEVTN